MTFRKSNHGLKIIIISLLVMCVVSESLAQDVPYESYPPDYIENADYDYVEPTTLRPINHHRPEVNSEELVWQNCGPRNASVIFSSAAMTPWPIDTTKSHVINFSSKVNIHGRRGVPEGTFSDLQVGLVYKKCIKVYHCVFLANVTGYAHHVVNVHPNTLSVRIRFLPKRIVSYV